MRTTVTPNFSLEEFACHDGTPYPAEWIDERLRPLCIALERIRAELGARPVRVISGFRSASHNTAIRGAKRSQHVAGRAVDFTVAGVTPAKVHAALLRLFRAGAIEIGGLGLYKTWVHVDVRPHVNDQLARWTGTGIGSETA